MAACDWGEMKGQDPKAGFPARLCGFPVTKDLEAKLKTTTLSFTADFLHGVEIHLGEVGTTSVTSIMLFSELPLYPNIESCFSVCYMVIYSETITRK